MTNMNKELISLIESFTISIGMHKCKNNYHIILGTSLFTKKNVVNDFVYNENNSKLFSNLHCNFIQIH